MLRLDPTDPRKTKVQTRDGREAKVYEVVTGQRYQILGAVRIARGEWSVETWGINGDYVIGGEHSRDPRAKACAILAADEAQFYNPMLVYGAKQIRDQVLAIIENEKAANP
jgi:thymidine kinase